MTCLIVFPTPSLHIEMVTHVRLRLILGHNEAPNESTVRRLVRNSCEWRRTDFTGLTAILSRTTAMFCSDRPERLCLGLLMFSVEPVSLNFLISLQNVDSFGASLRPRIAQSRLKVAA